MSSSSPLRLRRQPPVPPVEQPWLRDVSELVMAASPGNVLVMVPTGTARLGVHDLVAVAGGGAVLLPRVEALDSFVERALALSASPLSSLSRAAHRAVVAQVLMESCERHSLTALSAGRTFPGVVRAIDALFRGLSRHKLWEPEQFRTALHTYRQGEPTARDRDLVRVYEEYRRAVPDPRRPHDGLATESERLARVLASPTLLDPLLHRVTRIVWFGFADLPPLQADLVATLATRVSTEVIVAPPTDLDDDDTVHRVERHVRRAAERANLAVQAVNDPRDRSSPTETWTECSDTLSEIRQIAAHLRHELASGHPARTLAVAFANLDGVLPYVREVFPQYDIPFQAERGVPLASVPPIAGVVGLIELVVDRYRRQDIEDLARRHAFRRRVRHALDLDVAARAHKLAGGGSSTPAQWTATLESAHERSTREIAADPSPPWWRKREHESLERAIAAAADLFALTAPLERAMNTTSTAREFRTLVLTLMSETDIFSPPVSTPTPHASTTAQRDARALHLFLTTLDEFTDVLGSLGDPALSLPDWLARWQSAIADVWVSPMEETARGVPVVTIADLRFSAADTVFIGNLSDRSFPRRPPRDLFVPSVNDRERDFIEVPDVAADDIAALERERRSRIRLHLSVARKFRGADQLPASAVAEVVHQWARLDPPTDIDLPRDAVTRAAVSVGRGDASVAEAWPPLLSHPDTRAAARRAIHGLRVAEARDTAAVGGWTGFVDLPPVVRASLDPDGRRVFSSSALESYAGCAFKWFAEKLLHLDALDELDVDLTPQERGVIGHAIAEDFHRRVMADPRFSGPSDDPTWEPHARRILLESAETVLAAQTADSLFGRAQRASFLAGLSPELDIVGGRRKGMLVRFLDVEMARLREGWRVIDVEWRFGEEGDVPLPTPHGPVRVSGRVDRIDQHPTHGVLVFDYKTGNLPKARERVGRSFQLPLYIEAGRRAHPTAGNNEWDAAYYALKVKTRSFGPQSPLGDDHDGEKLAAEIGDVSAAIRAGSFPITLVEKPPCAFCDLAALCRVNPDQLEVRRRAYEAADVPVYIAEPREST